jgi:hypothetical protein
VVAVSRRRTSADVAPERTCYRCDCAFRVASDDRRVYCPACRAAYGFPAPLLADFTPGAQLALFPAGIAPAKGREVVRSA